MMPYNIIKNKYDTSYNKNKAKKKCYKGQVPPTFCYLEAEKVEISLSLGICATGPLREDWTLLFNSNFTIF